jgi:hypothetical protein
MGIPLPRGDSRFTSPVTSCIICESSGSGICLCSSDAHLPREVERIAPAVNSSENCRRDRRFGVSAAIVDIVSSFRKASTRSDQCHAVLFESLLSAVR